MKLSYREELGHILMSASKGTRLAGLTAADAYDLMFGDTLKYDRRRSFKKAGNRAWADGTQW
ncbi:MAG: hypothetical protein ACRC62_34935 [Microcoleus sp.]